MMCGSLIVLLYQLSIDDCLSLISIVADVERTSNVRCKLNAA